jgi:hypothetical protein
MLGMNSADLRLLTPRPTDRSEIDDAPTASPTFMPAAASKPFRIESTTLHNFNRLVRTPVADLQSPSNQ